MELEDVRAQSTVDPIMALTNDVDKYVVTGIAIEDVVAKTGVENVRAIAAPHRLAITTSEEAVVAKAAEILVCATMADEDIVSASPDQDIVASAPVGIVALLGADKSIIEIGQIVSLDTGECVARRITGIVVEIGKIQRKSGVRLAVADGVEFLPAIKCFGGLVSLEDILVRRPLANDRAGFREQLYARQLRPGNRLIINNNPNGFDCG